MNDQALAQALQCSDFAAAERCAEEYGGSVRAELNVTTGWERRAAIYREAIETLQNHLYLARVLRAHLAAQVQGNTGSCLYAAPAADRHCWQFDA